MDSPDRQASGEPELRLPDLDVMARSFQTAANDFQTVANELPKFGNIPAFNVRATILAEMREMR
jgi:hypothetical protein